MKIINTLRLLAGISMLLAANFEVWGQNSLSKNDFSGHWIISVTKSDFKGLNPAYAVAPSIVITETNSALLMQRFFNGKHVVFDTLLFSGKPFISVDTAAGYTRTSILSKSQANAGFTVASDYKADASGKFKDMKRSEFYSLSSDKKELTLLREFDMPDGRVTVKAVFDLIIPIPEALFSGTNKPGFDLAGKWQLNAGESYFGVGNVSTAAGNIEISQTVSDFSMESKFNESSQVIHMKLDGSTQILKDALSNDYSAELKWQMGSQTAILYFKNDTSKWKAINIIMLSRDKKELKVIRLNQSPVAFTEVYVYSRAQ